MTMTPSRLLLVMLRAAFGDERQKRGKNIEVLRENRYEKVLLTRIPVIITKFDWYLVPTMGC